LAGGALPEAHIYVLLDVRYDHELDNSVRDDMMFDEVEVVRI
jgi:hypothetical protein